MTTFDFEEVFETAVSEGFGPSEDLAVGKYRGKIVSAGWGESKQGDPKAWFMFKADEGSVSAAGDDVSGDTAFLGATFSEKAKSFAARDCTRLDITAAMLNTDPAAAVATAIGQAWSFELKLNKKGDWVNLYLGKRLDAAEKDDRPAAPSKPKPKAKAEPVADVAEEAADGPDPWDI